MTSDLVMTTPIAPEASYPMPQAMPPITVRKQRITKRESQAFTEWLRANPHIQEWSITQIIEEYHRISNITVSRMFVSNARKVIKASHSTCVMRDGA